MGRRSGQNVGPPEKAWGLVGFVLILHGNHKSELPLVNEPIYPLKAHQCWGKAAQAHNAPHMECWPFLDGSHHLTCAHLKELLKALP